MRKILLLVALLGAGVALIAGGWSYARKLDAYQLRKYLGQVNRPLYRDIKKTIQENDIDMLSEAPADTPRIRLLLSENDVSHFKRLYDKFKDPNFGVAYYAKQNQWRKATMVYNGETYSIKIKAHGKNPTDHKVGKFISFAIKLGDDENFLHSTRFSLIIRNRIQSNRQVMRHLAEHFGLIYHDLDLVRVTINDWEEKLFYYQPRFDDPFLEKKGLSSYRVFRRGVSETASSHKTMLNITAETGGEFSPDVFRRDFHAMLDQLGYTPDQKREIIARHEAFNKVIMEDDYEKVLEHVDLDYITDFDAFRTLTGTSRHGFFIQANFHVAYNFANGKFYPVVTDDIVWRKIRLKENETAEEFVDLHPTVTGDMILRFFNLLARNDLVRRTKYQKMYAAIEQLPEIAAAHEDLIDRFDDLHAFGRYRKLMRSRGMSTFPILTEPNFNRLRKYLEQADPEIDITQYANGWSLDIRPNSMAGVSFAELKVKPSLGAAKARIVVQRFQEDSKAQNGVGPRKVYGGVAAGSELGPMLSEALRDLVFSDTVDHRSQRLSRRYCVDIQFIGTDSAGAGPDIRLVNSVTGAEVDAKLRHEEKDQQLSLAPSLFSGDVAAADEKAQHGELEKVFDFEIDNDRLIIKPGVYKLHQNMVLPDGLKLVLGAGTRLLLGPGVLLVGKNGIEVRGTASNPVVIDAIDPNKPFAAVGILGTKQTQSVIDHLMLRNGSEAVGEGVYFLGALSIYHNGFVQITNSTISNNRADDGLNIKYSTVLIDRTIFRNNFADQVDLDYCMALVTNSRFHNSSGDSNGDGLDFSGSEAIVRECAFLNMADKGLSIGEKTLVYLIQNEFSNNGKGFAVKDSSICHAYDNAYQGNTIDVALYKKKSIWSGATCYLVSHADQKRYVAYSRDEKSQMLSQTVLRRDTSRFLQRLRNPSDHKGAESSWSAEKSAAQVVIERLKDAKNLFAIDGR